MPAITPRMQVLKDNFFYHSNARLGADDGEQHDERQLLVEEQRTCRARNRKFCLETKRRRKMQQQGQTERERRRLMQVWLNMALEERRKQWDAREQQLRESILQQRRQRVQDATERFQRAHLPPSQRRRQSFRKNGPDIEEALNHIQSNLSLYAQQSAFLSSSSSMSRSCTPSPKPPMVSKSSHLRAVSAVEAYAKLLRERSMSGIKDSQPFFLNESQVNQEREQDNCSPQEHPAYQLHRSDSLSSLDSLESEDHNRSTANPQCSHSSNLLNFERPLSGQRNPNHPCPSADLTSSLTKMFLSGDTFQQRKMHSGPQPKKQEEFEESNERTGNRSRATGGSITADRTPKSEAQDPLGYCGLLSLCEVIDSDTERFEESSRGSSPNDKTTVLTNNKVALGNRALEFSCPKQGQLDLRQHCSHDDRHANHQSVVEMSLPAKDNNRNDIFFEARSKPNISWNDYTKPREETVLHTAKENNDPPSKNKSSDSMNNLNKGPNSEPKAQRFKNTELQHQACSSNSRADIPGCLKFPGEEIQELAGLSHSDSKLCGVRFVKGILKKQSKYAQGERKSAYGSETLLFAKQVALSIRDSVELTRMKAKDAEGDRAVKKKLRWFDEENLDDEDKERKVNAWQQTLMKSKSVSPYLLKGHSDDHQPSLTAISGASRSGPSLTFPASTGYHFTKQAWADVGVQAGKQQEQGEEVRVPRNSARIGSPKVPRRERSARGATGPVSSRARKGTVMRPQSATEVSQIARAQGKIILPRPPPRGETADEDTTAYITKTTSLSPHHSSMNSKLAEQNWHRDYSDLSFASSHTQHVIPTDSTVSYAPMPPSSLYPSSEVPIMSGSIRQETQGCGSGRRGLVYDEKGLCLDCTPTDEEISLLWQGVRSALATKDGDPRNCLTHNGSLSALHQARANLSHVTINGDSLISGVKAVTRMSGFFLSPNNARSLVRRQVLESSGTRRKTCLESNRAAQPGSLNRKLPQASTQLTPSSSTYYLALPDEGLGSVTMQPSLAELRGEGLAVERDTMTTMDLAQAQRPGALHQRSLHQTGLATTLSLEEHKILLSLERLNHQLHCVQEYSGGDVAAARSLMHGDTPSIRESKATAYHKHRAFSADSRSRNLRRF